MVKEERQKAASVVAVMGASRDEEPSRGPASRMQSEESASHEERLGCRCVSPSHCPLHVVSADGH